MQLAVITLGLVPAFTTLAQDNNPQGCVTNEKSDLEPCTQQNESADQASFSALDWWPLEAVPESLLDRQCIICEGRYIDPLAQESTGNPPAKNDINARADSSWMKGNEVILIGDAIATQGDRHMRADKVVINQEKEAAVLSGNITLREPGVLLKGESAEIYSKTGEATVFDGQFVFHREHIRGTADILQRDTEGLIHIHNGNFTYCAPGQDDWSVWSEDMEVNLEEGLAIARNARIEVEGVPVFYTPWLRIPLDDRRRTGLLWPQWGNDSSGGLDISTPLYLNLAPNYDALYAPRYIEDRGLDHQLQLRYLNPLFGNWFAGGAYLKNDNKYGDQSPDDSSDRWLGVVRQNGLFKQRWRSKVDYSKASDVDYMKDLETANIDSLRKTSLLQLGSMDYLGDNWLNTLQVQKFQSLANDISNQYEKLPQFTNQYRASLTPFSLQPVLLTQYSNFDASRDIVTGQRVYGEAGLSYPMLWRFGRLKPTVKYRQVNYDLSDATLFPDNSPSAGSALASVDGNLIFERQTSFAGKGMLQTLEPRLYYLYSEYEDQSDQPAFDSTELTFTYYQLFRETRFSGHDRLGDANQVSVGLTSRLIDDKTGRSLLTASAGQIYYLQDRKVRLRNTALPAEESNSDFAGNLVFAPTDKLNVRSSLVWDPNANEDKFKSGFVEASYKPGNGSIFNLGYTYRRATPFVSGVFFRRPQTEEASASSYLPLGNNWSIFGAMKYSLENDISIEDMIGVEYDSCCWTVRLLQLRYYNNVSTFTDFNDPDLEHEDTIQFQFLLKGMGGFGNRITNIMQDMIRGFEQRDY
jgi:LPS-assembly protein